MRPIFLHAMWRTGSTYIWSKFREQPQYRAYYEPLNERLLDASADPLAATWSNEYTKGLRHPELDSSYFAEFQTCLELGTRLKRYFSYDYCLEEGDTDEGLRDYIADLLICALAHRQTPVLQFNRSLLRTVWLSAQFAPVNILLLRRPIDVWKSFLSYPDYFPPSIAMIVGQNQHHPFLRGLATRHQVPFFRDITWQDEFEFYRQYATDNLWKLYPLFYEFYLLTCIAASRHADCVIDLNEISESEASRKRVSERLGMFGINISFHDCQLPVYTDLTPEDCECLAYEASGCEYLEMNVAPGMRIPQVRFGFNRDLLGWYFRQILGNFVSYTEDRSVKPAAARPLAEEKYREGLRHFEQGRMQEALPLLRDAILAAPSATLWNDWASVQAFCKHPALAELGYRRALEFGDSSATANLGALLFALKRYEDAIPLVQRALVQEREPESAAKLASLLDLCRQHRPIVGSGLPLQAG